MRIVAAILVALTGPAHAQQTGVLSGYEFMEPATQEMQDDDFLNPAFLVMELGAQLWDQPWPGAEGDRTSCRACHGAPEAEMRGVSARYPVFDPDRGAMINLEQQINREIVERLGGEELDFDSEELLGLTILVGHQSRSLPMGITVDDRVRPWVDRGRQIFETRRGQLNLSCANCHEDRWGEKLRGDTISQGQINAFPIFRLTWDEVGSRHRMFTWCMEAIRSEPFAYGSDEYLALETFLAVRGQGLPIETPGVRR